MAKASTPTIPAVPAAGDPPLSPPVVKNTPGIKTPREIQLEKKVSVLEDKVGGLESALNGLNTWLADALPGTTPPAPVNPADPNKPAAPEKGFIERLVDDITGGD
jgi:hypothetical protein